MSFFQLAGVSAVTSWQRTPPPFSYERPWRCWKTEHNLERANKIKRKDNSLLKRLSLILNFACFNWIGLDHWTEKQGLVHTTQVISAFGARWLATSEVKQKIDIF